LNYNLINKSIASFLFNFITNCNIDFSFQNTFQNLKFIDIVEYKFNYVHNNFNIREFNQLFQYSHRDVSHSITKKLNKQFFSLDLIFNTNSNLFLNFYIRHRI